MVSKQKKPEAGKEMTKSSSTVGSCGCSIWVSVIIVVIVLFIILVIIFNFFTSTFFICIS